MPTVDELQKRVDLLQNQLRKAGEHLKGLAAENSTLGEHVEKLTESEAQLQAQARELTDSNSRYKTELENLKAANKEAKTSKEKLEADYDTKKQRVAELEKRVAEMGNKTSTGGEDSAESQLSEWETVARDWAIQLGVSATEEGSTSALSLLRSIKSLVDTSELNTAKSTTDVTPEMSQLRIDSTAASASAATATKGYESGRGLENRIAELETRLKYFADGEAEVAQVLDRLDKDTDIPTTVPETLRPGLERISKELCSLKAGSEKSAHEYKERIVDLEKMVKNANSDLKEATDAREELTRDYDLLLERIGTMKDALKAKMNAESDELKRLRKELAGAKSELGSTKESLTQQGKQRGQAEGTVAKLRRDLDETKKALWDSQELANRLQSEYSDLAHDTERQISELQIKLQTAERQLESEISQNGQFEDRIEQLQSDLNEALNSESQWVEERDVHLVTIQNLQSALESLQESKDAEIDMAMEKLREELRACTKKQRVAEARAEQAESRLRKIELSGATADQCQQRIADQSNEIERLRHEISVLKDHLNESMRRLREESNEFNLDKRVITNLVVGFLALPYGDSKRYEVLQLISSILQFSEEQQEKVGLIRKAGRRAPLQQSSPSTPASEPSDGSVDTKESFSDQWISFLLRESSAARNKRK
ncbi:hypothetical protein IW140_001246 [Coemansia sp. RSA 1813]|nr:hypothetical protein EV178_001164 [Coemansia sp. RSA 1646]KAJ1771731.1 hypothetical protein LPJ74_002033 [Coemansia sp. RSA 1843]KAJ2091702.1 hypothetical protein IW138_001685 [Coemansia sp. RSA 986]KAJ2216895.1 hypothetical protein EV179_000929 [Coemansia sp. RSA 487]KAJ2571897.1 hypothetical protein IW140_001246 [Coemansia sp. RSA 1813]